MTPLQTAIYLLVWSIIIGFTFTMAYGTYLAAKAGHFGPREDYIEWLRLLTNAILHRQWGLVRLVWLWPLLKDETQEAIRRILAETDEEDNDGKH